MLIQSKKIMRSSVADGGFTLLEVMIALVVLSFGLLGMALLQTSALRAGQSANYRSQATILAYDLADMIRANRLQAAAYGLIDNDDIITTAANCNTPPGANTARYVADRLTWICNVQRSLPSIQSGDVQVIPATATVAGTVNIKLTWVNDRSVDNNIDDTNNPLGEQVPRTSTINIVTGI